MSVQDGISPEEHSGTWDDARQILTDFKDRVEALGPEYAAVGAVSCAQMSVTAALQTESAAPIPAMQILLAQVESLRRKYEWSPEQMVTIVMGVVQALIPIAAAEAEDRMPKAPLS